MYDHQVQKYTREQQKAVYQWFVFSSITIGLTILCIVLMIVFQQEMPSVVNGGTDELKKVEQRVAQLTLAHDFIDTMQADNKKQMKALEQLALCIPDEVCLTELKLLPAHMMLKGNAYTHQAVSDFCRALEQELHQPVSIKTLEKQGALIAFEIAA